MKRFFTTILALFVLSFGFGQDMYWSVYHFTVKSGDEEAVVQAVDKFFDSETGKKLPPAAFGAAMFTNSSSKWTHEVRFAAPTSDGLAQMYSGFLQASTDFAILDHTFSNSTKPVASYLGARLLGNYVPKAYFATVYELGVSDPAAYGAAFKTLYDEVLAMTDGGLSLSLHQVISGNEPGATHVVVAAAKSLDALLSYQNKIGQSAAWGKFVPVARANSEVLRQFTTVTFKEYNLPEEGM